eukprot:GFYU01000845.1.p1 GENE.GFYU01000845.1~~GFYU01000845.1.p1  ORF type:complete len:291 (-),score=69.94 GFYU01000845.1:204-1076(-)
MSAPVFYGQPASAPSEQETAPLVGSTASSYSKEYASDYPMKGVQHDLESGTASSSSYAQPSLQPANAFEADVIDTAIYIRMGFVRKVYGILSAQLLFTALVVSIMMFTTSIREAVLRHPGFLWVAFFLSIGLLFALWWKKNENPANIILLTAWTFVEAYTVGILCCAFYARGQGNLVLLATIITGGVVLALTAYTFQSKRDFSGWGPALYAALWCHILWGLLAIFWPSPFGGMMYSLLGALLFSMYLVYDTYMILKVYDPEDYIPAAISLYLDIINLFIHILSILGRSND